MADNKPTETEKKSDRPEGDEDGKQEAKGDAKEAKEVNEANETNEAKKPEPEPEPESEPAGKTPSEAAPKDPEDEPAFAVLPTHDQIDTDKSPDSPADPPGVAPPGDSRSFRRSADGKEEFALVYRDETYLIVRRGQVGKEGTWSVSEYPSQSAAATAYAHACSDLTGEGFRDLQ